MILTGTICLFSGKWIRGRRMSRPIKSLTRQLSWSKTLESISQVGFTALLFWIHDTFGIGAVANIFLMTDTVSVIFSDYCLSVVISLTDFSTFYVFSYCTGWLTRGDLQQNQANHRGAVWPLHLDPLLREALSSLPSRLHRCRAPFLPPRDPTQAQIDPTLPHLLFADMFHIKF